MSKATYAQNNFTSGEISPRAFGRFDLAQYANALKKLENWLINQLGGAAFRPGTKFVAEVKSSASKCRIIPFQYSTTQNYIIELGNQYMRFYTNGARLVSGGSPVEVSTPYLTADLFELKFAQDADTMYIVHPDYIPKKLTRTSSTTFSLVDAPIVRGPFMETNSTTTTITPSADTGNSVTLTASSAIFHTDHVGSLWRVKGGVVKITTFTDTTHVIGNVQAEPDGTAGNLGTGPAATSDWAEGSFSVYRGYPATVGFHEQRLYYAGTPSEAQTFWGSVIRAFDNFDAGDGTADDDAVTFEIATEQANSIRWLSSGNKSMDIGTSGGTFPATGDTQTTITPSSISVTRSTTIGAANIASKRMSSYLYYIRRDLMRILELVYNFDIDAQKSNDMNLLSDHILRDGLGAVEMDHQQSPQDRLWVVRNDGQMAVLTRNVEQGVMGWSRIVAGNDSKGAGLFESVAIIQQSGDDDQVWVIVKRNIGGTVKRFVEYFTSEHFVDDWDPIRLDSSLSLDSPVTISGATKANPVQITANSHGFSNGDWVKIDGIVGMTELNGKKFIVSNKATNTFELHDTHGVDIDGTNYSTYISGGEVRKMVTAVTGLDHLEGETVSVTVDGAIPSGQQTFIVVSGGITLLQKAAVVHVGLPYIGDLQMLKHGDGSPTGTGQGKNRRIYLATIRIYRSLGLKIGKSVNDLIRIWFHAPNDPVGQATPLFIGDVEKILDTAWSKEDEILIRQDQPLPLEILAVITRSEVEEK
jgi:hypothetical protein